MAAPLLRLALGACVDSDSVSLALPSVACYSTRVSRMSICTVYYEHKPFADTAMMLCMSPFTQATVGAHAALHLQNKET
eukprot:16610-Heterococcus_DN1.PRE.10